MSIPVLLLILALGGARLTRLMVDDAVTLPVRQRIAARFGPESRVTYLAHCSWCTGMWISILLVGFAWATGLVGGLAVSALLVPAVAMAQAMVYATINEG